MTKKSTKPKAKKLKPSKRVGLVNKYDKLVRLVQSINLDIKEFRESGDPIYMEVSKDGNRRVLLQTKEILKPDSSGMYYLENIKSLLDGLMVENEIIASIPWRSPSQLSAANVRALSDLAAILGNKNLDKLVDKLKESYQPVNNTSLVHQELVDGRWINISHRIVLN